MGGAVTLRRATPDDDAFLLALYSSTREEELALTGWDDVQKTVFVRSQFEAQSRHYAEHYPDASFDVVVVGGVAGGRLIVARLQAEIRIVDIALVPAFRNGGIGTSLIGAVLAEGETTGRPVSIHVERFNRAMRLYERLGFAPVGEYGVYLLMQWRPPAQSAQSAQVNTAS